MSTGEKTFGCILNKKKMFTQSQIPMPSLLMNYKGTW